RDGHGNEVADQTVELTASGSLNTIVQPGNSDGHGKASGSLASIRAETKTITATLNPGADQVVLTSQPIATFLGDASNINAMISTVSVSPESDVVADGEVTAAITVTVRDANGNPVAGQTVQLAATGNGNVLTQPAVTD